MKGPDYVTAPSCWKLLVIRWHLQDHHIKRSLKRPNKKNLHFHLFLLGRPSLGVQSRYTWIFFMILFQPFFHVFRRKASRPLLCTPLAWPSKKELVYLWRLAGERNACDFSSTDRSHGQNRFFSKNKCFQDVSKTKPWKDQTSDRTCCFSLQTFMIFCRSTATPELPASPFLGLGQSLIRWWLLFQASLGDLLGYYAGPSPEAGRDANFSRWRDQFFVDGWPSWLRRRVFIYSSVFSCFQYWTWDFFLGGVEGNIS